jgi:hypothetical protein
MRTISSRVGKRSASFSIMEGWLVVARWRVEPSTSGTGFQVVDDYGTTGIEPVADFTMACNVARIAANAQLYAGPSQRDEADVSSGRRRRR